MQFTAGRIATIARFGLLLQTK